MQFEKTQQPVRAYRGCVNNMLNGVSAFWGRRSLKFWLTAGMLMTTIPLMLAAVAGYLFYQKAIIQPLAEVAERQRSVLQPLQSLQSSLWGISTSVIDYTVDGDVQRITAYRQEADKIDMTFEHLFTTVWGQGLALQDVTAALDGWQEVTDISGSILSDGQLPVTVAANTQIESFETRLEHLGRSLQAAYDDIRLENERVHDQALANLELSERRLLSAFVVSGIFAVLGVVVINRSLVSSMNQLAAGATRVAAGERDHQIQVRIPYELAGVAKAFNLMTHQILEQEKALIHAATIDGLTGLFNRREFDRVLGDEIRRAERYGGHVSVVMCDIDHFKCFNDTHGHQAGDDALRAVAQLLQNGLRNLDKACRFGGEEFVLVLVETNANTAHDTAERIRTAIEKQHIRLVEGNTANVTISMGVASYPGDGTTPDTLLKSADKALYLSKEKGRNRVTSST